MRHSPKAGVHSSAAQQRKDRAGDELVARDKIRQTAVVVLGSIAKLVVHSIELQQIPRPSGVSKSSPNAAEAAVSEPRALWVLSIFV